MTTIFYLASRLKSLQTVHELLKYSVRNVMFLDGRGSSGRTQTGKHGVFLFTFLIE